MSKNFQAGIDIIQHLNLASDHNTSDPYKTDGYSFRLAINVAYYIATELILSDTILEHRIKNVAPIKEFKSEDQTIIMSNVAQIFTLILTNHDISEDSREALNKIELQIRAGVGSEMIS